MTRENKTAAKVKQYYKVWFSNGKETTAKLVLDTDKYPLTASVESVSRLFPYTEAPKMGRLFRTSLYNSFMEAFHERSKDQDRCLPASKQFYTYNDAGEITGARNA